MTDNQAKQTNAARPDYQTSGSSQRPPQRLDLPSQSFDLADVCEQLRQEESYLGGDRNARTLVIASGLRVVVTVMRSGARLTEHKAPGGISVQTLAGRIALRAMGETIDLPAGSVVMLDAGIVHDVEATEESAFLLTIATA
jgi:quercetin dioxygenase-like cupin family protein